jgi:hypothetical protein
LARPWLWAGLTDKWRVVLAVGCVVVVAVVASVTLPLVLSKTTSGSSAVEGGGGKEHSDFGGKAETTAKQSYTAYFIAGGVVLFFLMACGVGVGCYCLCKSREKSAGLVKTGGEHVEVNPAMVLLPPAVSTDISILVKEIEALRSPIQLCKITGNISITKTDSHTVLVKRFNGGKEMFWCTPETPLMEVASRYLSVYNRYCYSAPRDGVVLRDAPIELAKSDVDTVKAVLWFMRNLDQSVSILINHC